MPGGLRWLRAVVGTAVIFATVAGDIRLALADPATRHSPALRRPVALVLLPDDGASPGDADRWLFTANRRSGTISVIDTRLDHVVDEITIGRQLSDLDATPDGRFLLATDETSHELLLLAREGPACTVLGRLAVSPYPVSLAVSPDGQTCGVASLWSRRLTLVDLSGLAGTEAEMGQDQLRVRKSISLPFAPREQAFVREGRKLIVADSFGGRLGIVDMARGELEAVRELPGHNIRGLAPDREGRKLLVSHQISSSLAETTHNDVHWGILMINVLRWLDLDRVLSPQSQILEGSHVHPVGDSNGAGGDPAGLAVTPDGTTVLALAGVSQVAIGQESDYALRQVSVGHRPTAVAVSRDGRRAYVANTFGDSISIFDLEQGRSPAELLLGPQADLNLADEGELLFYDSRLALDGWYSCSSCHTDGHTNGQLVDNLGDGSFGAAKRVLSLLGTGDTGPWAWNGGMSELETQIRQSIVSTMLGEEPAERQVQALSAYLRSLPPPPPLSPPADGGNQTAAARGRQVFESQRCADCHAPPAYTSPQTYDVGLADALGNRRFNPPSLRGVDQGGPYFHDNRAATLEEVFGRDRHGMPSPLPAEELRDLVDFLKGL